MPCAAIDWAAIRFTGDEADVCIFSFKLVLELVIKEKGELCPSVTVNQKENRIPLQPLLCKLWCLSFSFSRGICSQSGLCWGVCWPVSLCCCGLEPLALTIPHLYVLCFWQIYVGVCFLISWLLFIITEVSILSKLLLGFSLCPGKNFWLTLWRKSEQCQIGDFGRILPAHSFVTITKLVDCWIFLLILAQVTWPGSGLIACTYIFWLSIAVAGTWKALIKDLTCGGLTNVLFPLLRSIKLVFKEEKLIIQLFMYCWYLVYMHFISWRVDCALV